MDAGERSTLSDGLPIVIRGADALRRVAELVRWLRIILVDSPGRPPFVLTVPAGTDVDLPAGSRCVGIAAGGDAVNDLRRNVAVTDIIDTLFAPPMIRKVRIDPRTYTEIESIIEEMMQESAVRRSGYRAALLGLTIRFLVAVERCGCAGAQARAGAPRASIATRPSVWSMADVMRYVQDHYSEAFSLTKIAGRCALNTNSFSRAFKDAAGAPLFEYINKVRIARACALLKRTGKPVIEIAMDTGYNNISFFNRYFRRIMGMSPTQYRARAQR